MSAWYFISRHAERADGHPRNNTAFKHFFVGNNLERERKKRFLVLSLNPRLWKNSELWCSAGDKSGAIFGQFRWAVKGASTENERQLLAEHNCAILPEKQKRAEHQSLESVRPKQSKTKKNTHRLKLKDLKEQIHVACSIILTSSELKILGRYCNCSVLPVSHS